MGVKIDVVNWHLLSEMSSALRCVFCVVCCNKNHLGNEKKRRVRATCIVPVARASETSSLLLRKWAHNLLKLRSNTMSDGRRWDVDYHASGLRMFPGAVGHALCVGRGMSVHLNRLVGVG